VIVEQAFHHLPEILAGNHFPRQDYEGGIVAAFSLALLQEFNSRNALNPLSLIQCERPYKSKAAYWQNYHDKKKRYLRADLHLNLAPLNLQNSALSAYGFRLSNWIEAKFYRAFHKQTGLPKQNTNAPTHTGHLMADLYRLLALVPRSVSKTNEEKPLGKRRSFAGRYLLHVYSGDVSQHLSLKYRNGQARTWLDALTNEGQGSVRGFSTKLEPSTVVSAIGPNLRGLELDLECTNTILVPSFGNRQKLYYTCILSRIDAFRLTMGDDYWGIKCDGTIESSLNNDFKVFERISEFVGGRVGLKDDSEQNSPLPLAQPILENE